MPDLGCFKTFILNIDSTAVFGRGDCIVYGGLSADEFAKAALAAGAVPQHDDWCPCTEKQALKDFGDASAAGYYLEGVFEEDTTQFLISLTGKYIWFV